MARMFRAKFIGRFKMRLNKRVTKLEKRVKKDNQELDSLKKAQKTANKFR